MFRPSMMCALIVCLSASLGVFGCGPDAAGQGGWEVENKSGDDTSYEDDATVVVNTDRENGDFVVTGDGDGCVDIEGDCVDLEKAREESDDPHCDDPDARTDVIVEDGEVVDIICYPPKDDGTDIEKVATDEDGDPEVPQTENGTVVTFDEETNGEPIDGDLTIESEQTTIYGNGVDKTILDGNVEFESNESRLRSVTVDGNVRYRENSNNSSLAYCKIDGNLWVESNEFTGTNCTVFGNVRVTGNGARLVNIGVSGEWDVNANATCTGCYSFKDDNDDVVVQDEEVGDELTCDDDNAMSGGR